MYRVDSYVNGDARVQGWGNLCNNSITANSRKNFAIRSVAAFDHAGTAGKTVTNCSGGTEATNSGNGIVLGDVETSLVEYSYAFRNGANTNFGGGGPVGFWAYNSDRTVIQFNQSYPNRGATKDGGGLDLDGGVKNRIMQYN